jgi:hypothetical protein
VYSDSDVGDGNGDGGVNIAGQVDKLAFDGAFVDLVVGNENLLIALP